MTIYLNAEIFMNNVKTTSYPTQFGKKKDPYKSTFLLSARGQHFQTSTAVYHGGRPVFEEIRK